MMRSEEPSALTWGDVDQHTALAKRAENRWLWRRDRAQRNPEVYMTPAALGEADAIDDERRWHESMAARIAALLPPREPVQSEQPSNEQDQLRQ